MKRLSPLLLLLFFLPTIALSAQIEGVRLWTAPDHTRLVFDIDKPVEYRFFTLASPQRLVIDFKKARVANSFRPSALSNRHVVGLRHAQRKNGLRVVLDLKQKVKPKTFLLKPNATYGHRLVMDLYGKNIQAPGVQAKAKTTNRVSQVGRVNKAGSSKPRISKSEKDIKVLRDVVVAVDAGHGGEDPGASGSVKHTKEKHVTMQLAHRLKRLIDAQPGMRAVLTRKGDYYLGLRKRMKEARKSRADLFLSLHADAFHDKRVRGASVYVLSSRGASSEAARWLAEKENSADLVGGVSLDDKDDVLASVLLDLSQSATQHASLSAARGVYKNLSKVGKVHGRRVQQAGFMVLKSPDIPSMLVETGFISNPIEERNLRDPKYQEKMAAAIVQGVHQYFREAPPPGTLLAKQEKDRKPRNHVISRGDTLSHIANRYEVGLASLRRENRIRNDKRIHVGQVLRIPET